MIRIKECFIKDDLESSEDIECFGSHGGGGVVLGCRNGVVKVYDPENKKILNHRFHRKPIACVTFDRTGRYWVSYCLDNLVKISQNKAMPRYKDTTIHWQKINCI